MSVTQKTSNIITEGTEFISQKMTERTELMSEMAQDLTEDLSNGIDGASEGMSDVMESLTEDDSLQNERFAKYGDPSENIKDSKSPENPYDYPKKLRKYI